MVQQRPEEEHSGRGYAEQRDWKVAPPTYSDKDFLRKIAVAAGLIPSKGSLLVADLACGPGMLGRKLQELVPAHRLLFVDVSPAQIAIARQANLDPRNEFAVADIRKMPEVATGYVGAVVARYVLKDLTCEEKIPTLREINRIMKPKTLLAVADMTAPNPEARDWLNIQHGIKQEFEWRNPQTEGHCYIPTTREWLDYLHQAGFDPIVCYTHKSFVTTTQWKASNQIAANELEALNQFILQAPPVAKQAFNIREKDGLVKIDYPLIIIRAAKI